MRPDNTGPRVNEDIRFREVRVIMDSTGEQLGVLSTARALEIAQEQGLDLVEVAANARPPVCRIMDYGAFKFRKAKAAREAKKSQTKIELKEMHFKPRTADHDVQIKVRKVKEFLADGNRVLIKIRFKGREKAHMDLGKELMNKIVALVGDVNIEAAPKLEGDNMLMTLSVKKASTSESKPTEKTT